MNQDKTKMDASKKKKASGKTSASSTALLAGTSSCGPSTVMSTSPSAGSNVALTRRSSSVAASRKDPKKSVQASSSSRIRVSPNGARSPDTGSYLRTNILASRIVDPKSQAIVPKPRNRVHPIKTQLHNKNVPEEAAINAEGSSHEQVELHYNGPLDPYNIYTEKVRIEFQTKMIANLAGTTCDPEQFLKPETGNQTPGDPTVDTFFDRIVDGNKLLDYMVNHMEEFYDISKDPDAFSLHRQEMDDALWDSVAYIIPLLCRQMIDLLRKEPLIVELQPTESSTLIFGDIHGNFSDIHHIYKNFISNPRYERSQIVFLGDFVDRGPRSVEILCFVFALKLTQPTRIILLRGNHEEMKVNKKYGFKGLCTHIFQTTFIKVPVLGELIYLSFNRAFCFLPIGAVIASKGKEKVSKVFCCHGGIPSQYLKPEGNRDTGWTVADLNALMAKPVILAPTGHAEPQQLALNELLWNDPIPARFREKRKFKRKLFYRNKKRGGHCSFFTGAGLQAFLEANQLKAVIRGHQYRHCKKTGFQKDFGGALVTVFSSSNYCGSERNTTGYVIVEGGEVTPKVLRTKEESAKYSNFNVFKLSIDESTKEVNQVLY